MMTIDSSNNENEGRHNVSTPSSLSKTPQQQKSREVLYDVRQDTLWLDAQEAEGEDFERLSKGLTTQRFSKRIEGRSYHIRIYLNRFGVTCIVYFDALINKTTHVTKLEKDFLARVSPDLRMKLLKQGAFFRENAVTLFKRSKMVKGSKIKITGTPVKPHRRPPPTPSLLNFDSPRVLHQQLEKREQKEQHKMPVAKEFLQKELESKDIRIAELEQLLKAREKDSSHQDELKESQQERDALRKKVEEQESLIGSLRLQLMDLEAEKEQLSTTLQRDLENAFSECESICQQVEQQRESEVQHLQARNNILTTQVEELRLRVEGSESKAAQVERDLLEHKDLVSSLEAKLISSDALLREEREAHACKVAELEENLEIMTKSKNENREYGATIKAKLVDLQTTFAEKFEQLTREKDEVEEYKAELETLVENLRNELGDERKQGDTLKHENASMQKEIAFLAHKFDEALKNEHALVEEVKALEEAKARLEAERDTLVLERKERIVEFENQVWKRRTQYEEDMSKYKIQLFDANEALAKKKKDMEEAVQCANELMDQQDAIFKVLCESCTTKATQALAQ